MFLLLASNMYRYILTGLGEKLNDNEVDELLKNFDQKDGFINYENFVRTVIAG